MHRDYMMICLCALPYALCLGRRSAFPREGDPMLYAPFAPRSPKGDSRVILVYAKRFSALCPMRSAFHSAETLNNDSTNACLLKI